MESGKNIFDRVKERRSCPKQDKDLAQQHMLTCKFCDNLLFSDSTTLETHLVNFHQIINHKMTNYFLFDAPVVGSELVEKYLEEKITLMTKMNERVAQLKRSSAMEETGNDQKPQKKAKHLKNSGSLKRKLKEKKKLLKATASHLKRKPKKQHSTSTEETTWSDKLSYSGDDQNDLNRTCHICKQTYCLCNMSMLNCHLRTVHKHLIPPGLSPSEKTVNLKPTSTKKVKHVNDSLPSERMVSSTTKKVKLSPKKKHKHVKNSTKLTGLSPCKKAIPHPVKKFKSLSRKKAKWAKGSITEQWSDSQRSSEILENDLLSDGSNNKQCNVCLKTFFDKSTKVRHQITVHKMDLRATSYQPVARICNICHKEFYDKSTLNRHLRNVHKKLSLKNNSDGKCTKTICRKFINDPDKLKHHLCKYHTVTKATNSNTYHSKLQKSQTITTHSFTTSTISTQKKNYLNLIPEIRNDALKYNNMCIFCKQMFQDTSSVNRHMRQIHGIQNRTEAVQIKRYYLCDICQKVLTSKKERKQHQRLQACRPRGPGMKHKLSGEATCVNLQEPRSNRNSNNSNNSHDISNEDSREIGAWILSHNLNNEGLSFRSDPIDTDTRRSPCEVYNEDRVIEAGPIDASSINGRHEVDKESLYFGQDQENITKNLTHEFDSEDLPIGANSRGRVVEAGPRDTNSISGPHEVVNAGLYFGCDARENITKSLSHEVDNEGLTVGGNPRDTGNLPQNTIGNESPYEPDLKESDADARSPSSSLKSLTHSEQERLISYFQWDEEGSKCTDSSEASQKMNGSDLNLEEYKESCQSAIGDCLQDDLNTGKTSVESPPDLICNSDSENTTTDSGNSLEEKAGNTRHFGKSVCLDPKNDIGEQNVMESKKSPNKEKVILMKDGDDNQDAQIEKVAEDIKMEFADENHNDSQYLEEFPVQSHDCPDTQSDSENGNSEVVDHHTETRERTKIDELGDLDNQSNTTESDDIEGQVVDGKDCEYGREVRKGYVSLQEMELIERDRKVVAIVSGNDIDAELVEEDTPCSYEDKTYSEKDCSTTGLDHIDGRLLIGDENVNIHKCEEYCSNEKFMMSKGDYYDKFSGFFKSKLGEVPRVSDYGCEYRNQQVGNREYTNLEIFPNTSQIENKVGEYSALTECNNNVTREDEGKENCLIKELYSNSCNKGTQDPGHQVEGTQDSQDMDANIVALMDEMLAEKYINYSPLKFSSSNNIQRDRPQNDRQSAHFLLFSQHASYQAHRQVQDVNSDPNWAATFSNNDFSVGRTDVTEQNPVL